MIEQMMKGMHQQGGPVPGAMPLSMPAHMSAASGAQGTAGNAGASAGGGGGASEEGQAAHARSAGVGVAPPARSERPHAHEELDASLPTLTSFSKPLLLQDMGDKGAAAMARFRALLAAHHADKASEAVPPEEAEALAEIEALLQMPVAEAQMRTLPKACYRLVPDFLASCARPSSVSCSSFLRLLHVCRVSLPRGTSRTLQADVWHVCSSRACWPSGRFRLGVPPST